MNEGKFHINFLDYPTTNSNDKSQFEKYFKKHNPDEWKAGSGGGSFIFQDNNDNEFSIVILEDSRYGFSLFYDSPDGCFYSLGDQDLLGTFHTNDDEIDLPIGTYILIDKAWMAIQDFLDNPSNKSHLIDWIHVDNIEWVN